MKSSRWLHWRTLIFPLAVFCFLAIPVQHVNQIFDTTLRWAVLGVLAFYLLFKGWIWLVFGNDVGRAMLLLVSWAIVTTLWSQVPLLSLMKSGAFLMVAAAMFSAGLLWSRCQGVSKCMDYLFPAVALALFASGLGPNATYRSGFIYVGGNMTLYKGLIGNPNMLGSLMAMASSVILWNIYRNWKRRRVRLLWIGLLLVVLASLLMSVSRAALLMALLTGLGMLLTLDLRKRTFLLTAAVLLAMVVLAVMPSLWEKTVERYVFKGANQFQGIFYTRQTVWEESWELAKAGGWFGGGYGVTIGYTGFTGGLTAVGYGREKGNTQMAIMEETGIIGLVFYAAFLFILFRRMIRAFALACAPHEKVLLGILTGMLAGLTAQGIFEAWWVAPGSPEAAYWWAFVGMAVGVTQEFALHAHREKGEILSKVTGSPAPINRLAIANSRFRS